MRLPTLCLTFASALVAIGFSSAPAASHHHSVNIHDGHRHPITDCSDLRIEFDDRDAVVRTEKRRDGSRAVRFQDRYLSISECEQQPKVAKPAKPRSPTKPAKPSQWNKNFDLKKAPKVWQAAQGSGAKTAKPL